MFNYFTEIIALIFLGFAIVYPCFLWITPLKKIDQGFYRFNLGMCCVIGAIGATAFHFLNSDIVSESYVWIWFISLMIITALYWNSKNINNIIITAIAMFGMVTMIRITFVLAPELHQNGVWFTLLLGSAITGGVFFAMILGHWYEDDQTFSSFNIVNCMVFVLGSVNMRNSTALSLTSQYAKSERVT